MPNIIESTESKPKNKSADPLYTKQYYQANKEKMNADRKKNKAIKEFNMSPDRATLYGKYACTVTTIFTKCRNFKAHKPELIEMMLNDLRDELLEKNEDI